MKQLTVLTFAGLLMSPPVHAQPNDWKFHWVPHPDQRPRDFHQPEIDVSGWDDIPVPAKWELEGYGTPIDVNIRYPHPRNPPASFAWWPWANGATVSTRPWRNSM